MAKRDGVDSGVPDGGQQRRLSSLDRVVLQAMGDQLTFGLPTDPGRERWPQLWEWLSRTEGGRDHVMQPAVISIQLGPEGCLASITHRDLKRICSIACEHLGDALDALERALNANPSPIRYWGKDQEVRLRKRKPRS